MALALESCLLARSPCYSTRSLRLGTLFRQGTDIWLRDSPVLRIASDELESRAPPDSCMIAHGKLNTVLIFELLETFASLPYTARG